MSNMKRKTITIFPGQERYINEEDINLSQFVQRELHKEMNQ